LCRGAGGRNRTDTLLPEPDFESGASTSSATPAYDAAPRIAAHYKIAAQRASRVVLAHDLIRKVCTFMRSVPLPHIDEMAGDRRRRRHGGRDEVRAALEALPSLEIAVRG
jgi:hypothetical protein